MSGDVFGDAGFRDRGFRDAAGVRLPMDRAALERDIRERLFTPLRCAEDGPPLVGAEVEMLAFDMETRRAAPIESVGGESAGTLEVVRSAVSERGWVEESTPVRPCRFRSPAGDTVSWEPGGQLELSTRPCSSISDLSRDVEALCTALRHRAGDCGIELLAVGLDPWNPHGSTPLCLRTARYEAMARYFAALGDAGAMMMRQTAALQVNVDFAGDRALQWRVLSAAAPLLIAIFANSPRYAGEETGDRSHRAVVWRRLDPSRTGLPGWDADDPSEPYLDFALDAGVMARRETDGAYSPMRRWLARGEVGEAEWRTHLTTLFPEVRPRGFLEVRSCDTVDPSCVVAPLALVAGVALHEPTMRAAADLLRAADPSWLERAARCGLHDPVLGRAAADLAALGLAGCRAMGDSLIAASDLERARDWFERYTLRGRSPADDRLEPMPAADLVL